MLHAEKKRDIADDNGGPACQVGISLADLFDNRRHKEKEQDHGGNIGRVDGSHQRFIMHNLFAVIGIDGGYCHIKQAGTRSQQHGDDPAFVF